MAALGAVEEVEVLAAVELAQAFRDVLDAVGVDDVHDHGDAEAMGLVHQGLELLRGPEAGAQGEEVGDLVAEGTVVGVLLEGHDLDHVVAELRDARQHVAAEIVEGGDFLLLRAHADVALVDEGVRVLAGAPVLPAVRGLRGPDLGGEDLGLRVLDGAGHIGGDALPRPAGPLEVELVEVAVAEEHRGELELPVAVADGLEAVAFRALPVVEVADEPDLRRVRGVLAEDPAAVRGAVEAVIDVVVDRIGEAAVAGDVGARLRNLAVALVDDLPERFEPGVGLVYLLHGCWILSRDSRR